MQDKIIAVVLLALHMCVSLLQDLITFIKENYAEIHFHGVLDLVNILANAAYRPANFDDFSAFMAQVIEFCGLIWFLTYKRNKKNCEDVMFNHLGISSFSFVIGFGW